MKYTTVFLSLMAVASAVNLPNSNLGTSGVAARDEIQGEHHHHQGTTPSVVPRDESHNEYEEHGTSFDDVNGLEKRKKTKFRVGSNNNNKNTNITSDTGAFANVNIGVLVVGLAGAGIGAIFL